MPSVEASGDAQPKEDTQTSVLSGKRVLYVDDDDLARMSMAALLRSQGMIVETASNGQSGLSMFQDNRYDVVITDMSMPHMDGLQLTAELKKMEPAQPVIALTGWLDIDSRDEFRQTPPDFVLTKPVANSDLTGTLIRLLEDHSTAVDSNA